MPQPTPESEVLRTAIQPTRLRILEMVWDAEACVGEIADRLPVSVAAVSQHLKRLRHVGLVTVRAEGRRRYYRATKTDKSAVAVVLETFWKDKLDALARLARSVEDGPTEPEEEPSRRPAGARK